MAVNQMPYVVFQKFDRDDNDLIKMNIVLNDFKGEATGAKCVFNVELTIGRKTVNTSFFVVDTKRSYSVLLGRDWIHVNCCVPSTMH